VRPGSVALVGGQVRTLDTADRVAEALLIEHGRITAIGSSEDVRERAPRGVPVIDLEGRTALPGLIDAHTHLELSALADHFWVPVRFLPVERMLERIAAAVAQAAPGDWIVGQGTFDQPLPTRAQLDAVAPQNPVVVRESMHLQSANSLALQAGGVDRRFTAPVGIRVRRDPSGDPTGVIEEGFDLFPVPWPARAQLGRALAATAADGWVRHGITTIHELPASTTSMRAWQDLDTADALPCRMVVNPILEPGHQAIVDAVDTFARLGLATGFGPDWLRLGALKLFLDGVGDAALFHRQLRGPACGWGLQCFLYNELVDILARCRDAGVQVWMHAIGDAAQSLALDAIEEVNLACGPSDHRTRIEHAGLQVDDWDTLARWRAAGAIPVPTAAFMHGEADGRTAGLPDGSRVYPYKTMIAQGLKPPGNSDTAGTQPFATNPWHGIASMVLRENRNRAVLSPEEAVDVPTATRTYTEFGAHAGFDEARTGSLEVGKLGDVAVFAGDPFALDVRALPDLEAELTVVSGRVVHGDPDQVARSQELAAEAGD
jgi:predicted amidohydrolase YtcJ